MSSSNNLFSETMSSSSFHLTLMNKSDNNIKSEYALTLKDSKVFESKNHQQPYRSTYRIVLKEIEPYLIVSDLDPSDSTPINMATGTCKDGLQCYEVTSPVSEPDSNDFATKISTLFRKEQLIHLVKSSKLSSFSSKFVKKRCCTGYIINLLQTVSKDLGFASELYFTPNCKYGELNRTSNYWNGCINHVISGVAHVAAGPFSLTQDRARFVDFSVPFLHSVYALLVKNEKTGVDDLFM